MRRFLFTEYSDANGIGSEKIFQTREEAVTYADREWDKMHPSDREKRDLFRVTEIEMTEEQLNGYNDKFSEVSITDDMWVADIKDYK